MPEGNQQQADKKEFTPPIEQQEALSSEPSVVPENLHEYRDQTKQAGEKSTKTALQKIDQLRTAITPEQ